MTELIVGDPPEITLAGNTVTYDEYDLDWIEAQEYTTSHYLANVTRGTSKQIAAGPTKNGDGSISFTVTDAAGWDSGDRIAPLAQSEIRQFSTIAAAVADGDTVEGDIVALWFNTGVAAERNRRAWDEATSNAGVSFVGMASGIVIIRSTTPIVQSSAHAADLHVRNLTLICSTYSTYYPLQYSQHADTTGRFTLERCVLFGARGIALDARQKDYATAPVTIGNCVIAGNYQQGTCYGDNAVGWDNPTVANCAFIDCHEYPLYLSGRVRFVNCLVQCDGAEFGNDALATFTNCAFENADVDGATNVTRAEIRPLAEGRIESTSSLVGAGTTIAGVTPTVDIDGQARADPPAIGASEGYAISTGGAPGNAPSIAATEAGDTQVTLTLAPGDGETADMYVRYAPSGGPMSAESASFKRSGAGDVTVTGLTNGTPYSFQAYHKNADGLGPWSVPAKASPTAGGSGMGLIGNRCETIAVEAASVTRDDIGGSAASWSTRTTVAAFVQEASASIRRAYERRGLRVTHTVYVHEDPGCAEGDRLDRGGVKMIVRGVVDQAGLGRLWRIDADERR